MTNRNALLALSAAALLSASANAADLLVPAQFPTIQSAVNAAAPGDKVRIADGVYDEDVVIQSKSNLSLKGDDDVFVSSLRINDGQLISVKEITFTDSQTNQLDCSDSSQLDIRFCSFTNGAVAAVFVTCNDVNLRDSDIKNVFTGFVFDSCKQARASVLVKNVPGGNHVAFSENVIVEDCPLKNTALFIFGSKTTTVRGNAFKKSNLVAHNSTNVLLDSNSFKKSGVDAISLIGVTGSTVQLNAIKKATFNGIDLDENSDDNLVFGNGVKKAGQIGIQVDGVDNTIDQNFAVKSNGFDLLVVQKDDNTIGFNIVGSSNL